MTAGHLGEWIAAQILDIELEASASTPAIDGRFRTGPLRGNPVNIKWRRKREGTLDITESPALHHYLVLTGPARHRRVLSRQPPAAAHRQPVPVQRPSSR